MKRYLLLFITGLTLLWSATSHALGDGTLGFGSGANSNPHNLSAVEGNTNPKKALVQATPGKETQICIFCHTPHGATPQSTLWGRNAPDGMGSFPIRTGLFIDDDPGIVNVTRYSDSYSASSDYPNGTSKLCLSCHDGVTAMGILANGDEIDMSGGNALGIDLTTSHPISFVYNSDVRDYLELQSPGSYQPWPPTAYLDSEYRVQCTICHQPHQDTRNGGANLPFWRVGDGDPLTEYDPVCQACHASTPTTYTIPNSHTH